MNDDLIARLRAQLQWRVPYAVKPLRDLAEEAADALEMAEAKAVTWERVARRLEAAGKQQEMRAYARDAIAADRKARAPRAMELADEYAEKREYRGEVRADAARAALLAYLRGESE